MRSFQFQVTALTSHYLEQFFTIRMMYTALIFAGDSRFLTFKPALKMPLTYQRSQ
jgi:hypothetical protein